MRATDKPEFKRLMGDAMAFYRQDVSTFALSVWWQACERFDLEQVRKALTAHAMDPERGQFPPKPADIVRVLQGTHTDRALIAWGKVFDAMRTVGQYQSVAFDDPAIHLAIVDMGDWPTLCRTEVDELPFLQRRFCDLYRTHATRGTQAYPARLVGVSETTNQAQKLTDAQRSREVQRTVLIGDAEKAKAVMAAGGAAPRHQTTTLIEALPEFARIGSEV